MKAESEDEEKVANIFWQPFCYTRVLKIVGFADRINSRLFRPNKLYCILIFKESVRSSSTAQCLNNEVTF